MPMTVSVTAAVAVAVAVAVTGGAGAGRRVHQDGPSPDCAPPLQRDRRVASYSAGVGVRIHAALTGTGTGRYSLHLSHRELPVRVDVPSRPGPGLACRRFWAQAWVPAPKL